MAVYSLARIDCNPTTPWTYPRSIKRRVDDHPDNIETLVLRGAGIHITGYNE